MFTVVVYFPCVLFRYLDRCLQKLANDPSVLEKLCGAVVADGPVFPGETWRGTMEVDTDICKEPVYSMVGMLSELSSQYSVV